MTLTAEQLLPPAERALFPLQADPEPAPSPELDVIIWYHEGEPHPYSALAFDGHCGRYRSLTEALYGACLGLCEAGDRVGERPSTASPRAWFLCAEASGPEGLGLVYGMIYLELYRGAAALERLMDRALAEYEAERRRPVTRAVEVTVTLELPDDLSLEEAEEEARNVAEGLFERSAESFGCPFRSASVSGVRALTRARAQEVTGEPWREPAGASWERS